MNLKLSSSTSTPVKPGRMIVFSGPSGAGKSTVVRHLFTGCSLPLALSISATTRSPRNGEEHGRDYFFLPRDEFDRRRRAGEFLECKEVYGRGDWYGTLQSQVAAGLEAGNWVVLEIDVEGMRSVVERYPETITFFIHCGGIEELERRLRARNTDTEEAISRRLEVARHELAYQNHYRYQILNDDVDESVRRICEILQNLGARRMLDDLREEGIVNKVGGRFKLSTLIQKRMVQLNKGGHALVDLNTQDRMQIVLEEILQDKIFLDASNNLRTTEFQGTGETMELDLGDL